MTDDDRRFEPLVDERQLVLGEDDPVETRNLSHASIRDLFSDYLEGTLSASQQELVRQHVDHCQSCRAFLRTLESTVELTGRLPSHQLPDRVKRRILDRLVTTADSSSGGA